MSLADELLADLEENEPENVDESASQIEEREMNLRNEPMEQDDVQIRSVREICKLRDSKRLAYIIDQVMSYSAKSRKSAEIVGPVESDPEYRLIVEANNTAAELDAEIVTIHKFVRDKYQKRFPELESLVVGSLEYVKTVKELGNDLDQAKNNETLQQFLTQATIMVVSVTASTTQGK